MQAATEPASGSVSHLSLVKKIAAPKANCHYFPGDRDISYLCVNQIMLKWTSLWFIKISSLLRLFVPVALASASLPTIKGL